MYRVQTNLGRSLQLEGQTQAALAAYNRALELDQRHGDAYNNIATLYHQQGAVDQAISWYWKGLERYPGCGDFTRIWPLPMA